MTVALVGTTFFLTTRQEKQYTASSLVRVEQNITDATQAFGALQTGERLARTYAEIARTSTIADRVAVRLAGVVPRDQIKVKASQLDNLELLRISVTNPSPATAAKIANAVPPALSEFITSTGSLRDRITTVEPARPPKSPSSPSLTVNLTIAVLLGLLINAALALLLDTFSDRFEGAEELETITGQTVIASIPTLKFVGMARAPASEHIPDATDQLARVGRSRG